MQRFYIFAVLVSFSSNVFAQVIECNDIQKAIQGASVNFVTYTNYKYQTKGGQSAYLSNFSFASGKPGYVYYDPNKNEKYFYQTVNTNQTKYKDYYNAVEQCVLKEKEKWTKLEAKDGKAVVFLCDVNGVKIHVLSGSVGVVIKVLLDKRKTVAVLRPDFCDQIDKLVSAAANGFTPIMGKFKDSSAFLGKSYESTLQINQRGYAAPAIYIRKSYIEPDKMQYSVSESFADHDITYAALLEEVSNCFDQKYGWKKAESKLNKGWVFKKDNVELSVYESKLMGKNSTYIKVEMLR